MSGLKKSKKSKIEEIVDTDLEIKKPKNKVLKFPEFNDIKVSTKTFII